MEKPLLQLALDHTDLESALESLRIMAAEIDVLEAGTILCFAEGLRVISAIRKEFPDHIILADLKAADAGTVLASQVFERGADLMTVICNAPEATMSAALEVARKHGGDVQVELYGDWTFDHARLWRKIGLKEVVYHRGRDAAAAGQKWSKDDLDKIRQLSNEGFAVSVTGGLAPEDLAFFKALSVKAFISGRSLYGAEDPLKAARSFREAIDHFAAQ